MIADPKLKKETVQFHTIFNLARRAVEERAVLHPTDEVTLIQNNGLRVYLSRWYTLLLMTAETSEPYDAERVRVGHYSVYSGWTFELDWTTYQRWMARVKALAHGNGAGL